MRIFWCLLFISSLNLWCQDIYFPNSIKSIGFGSCNRIDLDQKIWDVIANQPMNAWVWLGDIVYTEGEKMDDLALKYSIQKSLPAYRKLSSKTNIFGIWDDHDFGKNDGGSEFRKKQQSRDLLFDFLDLSTDHPARSRNGAYQSYCFGVERQKVCLYLLDVRYFKEEYEKDLGLKQRYKKNNGSLLGEEQWRWLEKELLKNDAEVNLLAGGIQLISSEHAYEKWANFPKARQRLFDLLIRDKIKNPIYLSGDRHFAEVSVIELLPNYKLYDITSSGLTHSYEDLEEEFNSNRISPLITSKNFGMIRWNWDTRKIALQIYNIDGRILYEKTLKIQ